MNSQNDQEIMIQGLLKKIFGDKSAKDRKDYQPIIDQTIEFGSLFISLSDDELRAKTNYFQNLVKEGTQSLENEVTRAI